MKKVKNPKIGDVIRFPHHQFDQRRHGWNGWLFRAAIIEGFGVTRSGKKYATIRYCTACAGRNQLLPNTEATKNVYVEYLFEYNLDFHRKVIREFLEYEAAGEPVCWDQDAALLVNHNLV